MKFPNELYVVIDGDKPNDEFFDARADAEDFAVVGETVPATLYRKVGPVRIKASAEVIKPK